MFMICNADIYKKNGDFLNEEVDPVEFIIFKKIFSSGKTEIESERVFKEGLFSNFFLKSEKGKDYHCTFRGDRGIVEFVKQYFLQENSLR